jgi:hypothetical protein
MDEHLGERLSAYVDGALEGAALAAAEAHLAGCAECRAAAEELRRVVGLARALDDRPPERDLWSGIAERIGAARADAGALVLPLARRRRFTFSLPQLAAAGLALSLLSAGAAGTAVHFLAGRSEGAPVAAAPLDAVARHVAATAAPYDAAITELEAILAARRGELDSSTVRTVEASLRVIDLAIAQARAALVHDPNNSYLNGHLRSTLDRKLDLLRRAAMLPRVS